MTVNSPDESQTDPRQRKSLVLVEDNLAANRGLTRFLHAQGYNVSAFTNGCDAIEFLRRETTLEIVLTDLQLPDMDGREVIEFAANLRPRPRIGAITAWDIDPQHDPRLAELTDWIMLKPLDLNDLLRRLKVMGTSLPPSDSTPVAEGFSGPP